VSTRCRGVAEGDPELLSDKRYFARRAVEEASRAARSLSPTARSWHQELADKFSALAREACADERIPA
jgi:hypothetical protein